MSFSRNLLLLHNHPQFMKQCSDLLNDEWPRSEMARFISLEKSCDELPTSLLMTEMDNNKEPQVIGHSRLCNLPTVPDACWIESVIIRKDRRGKGLGKALMRETEEYAKSIGFRIAYLSTHDKQEFYKHLGYIFCQPVQLFGTPCNKLKIINAVNNLCEKSNRPSNDATIQHNNPSHKAAYLKNSGAIPPPPPPLPKKIKNPTVKKKQWMKKELLL